MLDGFPGGSDSKEFAYNAGDPGSIPGLGRSPRCRRAKDLCPMDRDPAGYSPWGSQRVGRN